MIIDDIIESIDDGGPKSYYSFEAFVQNLLKYHIENQKKELLARPSSSRSADIYAPIGFDDFVGPTAIEIKFNLAGIPVKKFLENSVYKLVNEFESNSVENLLLISAKPIPRKFLINLQFELELKELPFKLVIWGPKELNSIAAKHRKVVNNISKNLFSLRLNSVIQNSEGNWKKERDDIINDLRACYDKGMFSLFLGAGVSSSAGMPDWNTLLNSLFVTYLDEELDDDTNPSELDVSELVNRLNTIDEPTALMAARYLRKGLSRSDNEAKGFRIAVTRNLYSLRNKKLEISSELLKSIASMCLPKRTGAKVKSVISYNFDDLLERQLEHNSIDHRCIYTENERYAPEELPVYHVHGFLPEDTNKYEGLDKSTLVFSEEGYHQIYSDHYHWSNLVQLNSFRESNCLMIGLSMTDPNLRRLLDISSKNTERSKHFAFMQRLSLDDFCFEEIDKKKVQVIKNMKSAENFLKSHHKLNEELMKELGVTVIWYEGYNDIPEIINQVVRNES